ncbi:long-chain-fatty-acid--CoA ligase [Amylibacter sp. IMCC11727]|uniref:long-chain-fatty-acid--CoA ligase n=1 Tax=Amylibacter sp. IMCC11727 TaxID=3039851 RepID=UPI00244E46CD|nr:long-chain-fatty-acid--CoA ligase [Amylibacter sp. IMCC11727]WGI23205.1 long-chain-fatty-acid--CoA ligase [Amylibacter sp. IMCC11727]
MQGLMMNRPLRVNEILTFAAEVHGDSEVVSVTVEGGIHRTTYRDIEKRTRQLANVLKKLGVDHGDRVATLAWNGYRHLELYYGIAGIGAVCHTINPRLSAEQMIYIVNHAEDKVIFVDLTFIPILNALQAQLPKDLIYVAMTDRAHMPETDIPNLLCYEDLMDAETSDFDWPEFDENTACGLCYTSGTTGNPKGALYSHRSTVLHAMMGVISLQTCLRPGKRILPVVPLFHVNAWGLPYAAPLSGASLIFPGAALDGPSVHKLMEDEQVFSAWGVPTVWMGLLGEIKAKGGKPSAFGEVIIGGSAAPRPMIEAFENMDVSVCHAWGMTEMSPIGTVGVLNLEQEKLPLQDRIDLKAKQGRRVFGVDLKIVDEDGNRMPHDGVAQGELFVRGNAIVSGYFKNEEASKSSVDAEGWFGTGDVAKIEPNGMLTITDRAKDLIKSGGEWISSIDVENMAMAHENVANCAVIAIPDKKWDERPLLIVVPTEGAQRDAEPILDLLSQNLAKWQVPDEVVFVDDLPLTATGKVSKLTLRQRHNDGTLMG